MADTDDSVQPWPGASRVRPDVGGWISGPSLSTEPVPAEQVRSGDTLILDDGTVATVTDIRHGDYWLTDGHGPGVAVGWRSASSRGVLFRKADDSLSRRVRGTVAN